MNQSQPKNPPRVFVRRDQFGPNLGTNIEANLHGSGDEWISKIEVEVLLREARAEAFEEASQMLLVHPVNSSVRVSLFKKAAEIRSSKDSRDKNGT